MAAKTNTTKQNRVGQDREFPAYNLGSEATQNKNKPSSVSERPSPPNVPAIPKQVRRAGEIVIE
jgi:hypothetical protein